MTDLVLKEIPCIHITEGQGKWYANLLHELASDNKSIDDLIFPIRYIANYIHNKRSNCQTCYNTFSEAYK